MPHATSMPSSGFRALILCGPGASLSTFTAKPEDFPKATIPIANRPMVWYALDYCYRMGINDIFIITPPASAKAIEDVLNTNPHLTSLPAPKPAILSPKSLTHESGTADVLRQPEVQKVVTGDFVVLPCDIVSEVPGESLLEAWMIQQQDLDGLSTQAADEHHIPKGGLGVWYPTKGELSFKGEETDFLVTAPIKKPLVKPPEHSIQSQLQKVQYSMPTDSLNDILEEQKNLLLRPSLFYRSGTAKIRTTHRDAHIYVFPQWVTEMVKRAPELMSMSEDVVGNWAKATWQDGFAQKLSLGQVFDDDDDGDRHGRQGILQRSQEPDFMSMSSTRTSDLAAQLGLAHADDAKAESSPGLSEKVQRGKFEVPPFLGYVHPLKPSGPLLRRVDNMPTLLNVSLRLAKLESVEEAGKAASPFAHAAKIAYPAGIAQRCTVTKADCLLAENVRVEERSVIKESVIGANCTIKNGARLTRCLLMDEVVIGEKCQLTDCIVGRRARIGKDSVLKECRVQDGNVVADETDAKGEDIMVFEGLEEEGDFGADEGDGDGEGISLG